MSAVATKERPILFSGPMMRAILEDRKRVARRVMKPQPPEWIDRFGYTCFTPPGHISGRGYWRGVPGEEGPGEKFFRSPYGVRGDLLYVRENLRVVSEGLEYAADQTLLDTFDPRAWPLWDRYAHEDGPDVHPTLIPSIHMPKWAARLWLRVESVRVERVQAITESQAAAEGVPHPPEPFPLWGMGGGSSQEAAAQDGWRAKYRRWHRERFRELWDELNAPRGFGLVSNPWVWVVEFSRAPTEGGSR